MCIHGIHVFDEKQITHLECNWQFLLHYVYIYLQNVIMNKESYINPLTTNERDWTLVANCQIASL